MQELLQPIQEKKIAYFNKIGKLETYIHHPRTHNPIITNIMGKKTIAVMCY